jgi:hypothetical protein
VPATRVTIFEEVSLPKDGGWVLCFQWGRYDYGDGETQRGYRFIWRRPVSGSLQAARGQARLPSVKDIETLIGMARDAGWGHHNGDAKGHGTEAA